MFVLSTSFNSTMILMVDFGDEMLQWSNTPTVYIRGRSLDLPKDNDIKVATSKNST